MEKEGRTLRRRRVRRGGVALRRARVSGKGTQEENFKIVAYTQTDENGFFEFPGLDLAEHEIKVDWPGIPMNVESDIIFDVTETTLQLEAVVEGGLCSVFIIDNDTLGIKSNIYDRQLLIYPNPAYNRIFIEPGDLRGSNYSISISDISGKVVSMALINPNQIKTRISVYIGHLKQGIYLVRLHDDLQRKVLKVSRLLINR